MSAIRRQINIHATPRTVWRALTTPDGWCSWYADEARIDARAGGRVVLTSEGDDGEPIEESGVVLACRPTSRLEIRWDARSRAPTRGGQLAFKVALDGDSTRLSLVYSGGEALDDEETRSGLDRNWRQAFSALRDHLEG
jgi:uncharacterized protein YndB with AHSA1/START domain